VIARIFSPAMVSTNSPAGMATCRHWLVAMRYSQERSDERSWNPASPRQAAGRVSGSRS
jgi:hypothetical protein